MNRILVCLTVVLFVASCLFGFLWAKTRDDLDQLRGVVQQPWQAEYEGRAFQAKAISENAAVAAIQRLSFPLTIELADRVCVELRSAAGATDGGDVYCFDKETKKLVEHFQPPT